MTLDGRLSVSVGDAVTFEFIVTNGAAAPEELSFRSGHTADFAVFDGEDERWRWSEGRMFTQALQSATLEPGESVTYAGTWDDPSPGDYTAVATLAAENRDVKAEEQFSV